jgi:predicted SprT family Zn-dependent metalloprotease
MEKFRSNPEMPREEPMPEPEMVYRAMDRKKEKDVLSEFTPEQQAEIKQKQQTLSSLAYFIGKDFRIPVELNQPGAGWHWDFQENVIRIDPKDLLEKPMDYLRFVISHEGGHRRISRTDFIPLEEWKQPGFAFMMNAIEDPRDNNFVAEAYPKFREQMGLAYQQDLDFEGKAKEKASQKLGYQPRFMQAGFEYIKQWFKEAQGQEMEMSVDLPEEVKAVVQATIEHARDSWWRYPSREEADKSEELIKKYAQVSYEINRDEIWPEFKKLIEADMEDQKTQELLRDMQKGQQGQEDGESGPGLPQELKDKLTPEEQKALEEAVKKAIEDAKKDREEKTKQKAGGKSEDKGKETEGSPSDQEGAPESEASDMSTGKPVDLGSLPEGLKQKIKEYIDSLPKEQQKEIAEKAQAAFKEFEDALNEEMQGKLSDNPEKKAEREEISAEEAQQPETKGKGWEEKEKESEAEARERRKRMESLFEAGEKDPYHEALEKVSGLIDALTSDLRDIFIKRKIERYETGYRSGRRWNIRQRIREKVAGIPLFKTEAREQREAESEEMDYAITLLVDLSGSMQRNGKIQEAFKSAVVLSETLNNLGIKFEIVGFQDMLLEFKSFEEQMDEPMREKLNQLILEVYGNNPGGHNNPGDNDDGASLLEASKHLTEQIAKNKFLIVLSDGEPAMDSGRKSSSQLDRELRDAVAEITANTNQKIIGLGLNSQAVAKYYENHIAGITTEEMAETLGELLREVIEKY